MSPHQHFKNSTSLGAKKLGLSSINQISSLVNGNTSLKVVTLLYQYKFKGDNLTLLCKYTFGIDNLALLIKSHMSVVIILVGGNLVL